MSFGVLRKLCLALALIMSGVATMGQSIDRSVEIHFRQGSSVYDPNYRGNAERLQKFSDEIVSLHARNYEIVRAEFQAGTSPEGPERVNARLAAERLRNGMSAFLSVIGDDIVLQGGTSPYLRHPPGRGKILLLSLRQAKASMAAPPFSKSCETAVLATTPRRQPSIVWGGVYGTI